MSNHISFVIIIMMIKKWEVTEKRSKEKETYLILLDMFMYYFNYYIIFNYKFIYVKEY